MHRIDPFHVRLQRAAERYPHDDELLRLAYEGECIERDAEMIATHARHEIRILQISFLFTLGVMVVACLFKMFSH